jgi:uncharacterized MAPEG superfamily protein
VTTWILAVLGVFIVQTLLPACLMLYAADDPRQRVLESLGPRDNAPPLPVYAERARRALNNMHESLPVFITLSLLVMIRGEEAVPLAQTGAMVFFFARTLYVPAYLAGIRGLRSAIWGAGGVGLAMIAYGLLT